jgi:hypothetical protein
MSCALASPENGVCANKRPVQGRRSAMRGVDQPQLTPLAVGHAAQPADEPRRTTPFAADAPEATFSIAQVRDTVATPAPQPDVVAPAAPTPIRSAPPSFREIRAGRAAAAGRAPVAELRIPVAEVESGTLLSDAAAHAPRAAQCVLPGIDQLVERVRQRTAARLNHRNAQPTGA